MRYIVFLVLIGFAGILSTNVYAMPPFHSQEIYDFSNVIAVGKVISVDSTFSPTHNLYEIKVEKFLKNQQDSDVLFASGQKTANIRLGNQVFDVNDRGLFYLTNNTMGYDLYSGIFLVYPTSQLIEPEWDKCNIFDKEIPREHWVFGGAGQMPSIRQGNNTDIENFAIDKEVLVSYDIFNHSSDAKNVTYGIMIKKIDEPDYLYTETNNSYLLEPCVPYKTLTWTFTPTKSGQYAAEIYDLVGSQMGVGFTARSDLDSNSKVLQSPLKQFKAGIPNYGIQCKEEFELAFKASDGSPACIFPESIQKLVERGWGTSDNWIKISNSNKAIHYELNNATISSINAHSEYTNQSLPEEKMQTWLQIRLESTQDGSLQITLPRNLIDAKINALDDDFFVLLDGIETNYQETKTNSERVLDIHFPAKIDIVEIVGYGYYNPELNQFVPNLILESEPQSVFTFDEVLTSCTNDSTKERMINPLKYTNGTHVFLNLDCKWERVGYFIVD